jgi:hypothetical protein
MIGVDEVQPHRLVPHQHLSGSWSGNVDMLRLERFRPTGFAQDEGVGIRHDDARASAGQARKVPIA